MSSHFSSIGFNVHNEDDLVPLIKKAERDGEWRATQHGGYLRWKVEEGAELWLGIDKDNSLATVHPHFYGETRMKVGLTERILRDPEEPFEGAFHGWANGLPETGCYPFLFDVPDFDALVDFQFPALQNVQLAAFAHEISAYHDDQDFRSRGAGLRVSAESFIPIGSFQRGETASHPASTAAFSGHVLSHRRITNSVHGGTFWSMRVQTYGGIVEAVADTEILDKSPVEGGVIHGVFWLSGRIMD